MAIPGLSILAIVIIAFWPSSSARLNTYIEALSRLIWERGLPPKLAMVSLAAFFYLFRLPTYFTGDGYHLLNSFGGLSTYHAEATKYGAVLIIRVVQGLLGEFTYESAQTAFQIVSIICGAVTILLMIGIVGELSNDRVKRLLSLMVLLFSGGIIIFFGHVEFYSMVWVATSLWLLLSLRNFNQVGSIAAIVAVFGGMVLCHVESLSLLPALFYLLWRRVKRDSAVAVRTSPIVILAAALPVLATIGSAVLSHSSNEFARYFLPLTGSRGSFADYSILSWQHLHEIGNLIIALCPAVVVLVALLCCLKDRGHRRDAVYFLLLASSGGLSFVLVIKPELGMARDIDLMSLAVFPTVLLLLSVIGASRDRLSARVAMIVAVVCVAGTVTFMAANISRGSAENRVLALLTHYGERDRGGWNSFAAYTQRSGNERNHRLAITRMYEFFPGDATLKRIDSLVRKGGLDEAEVLASRLVERNPNDGVYLRTLASIQSLQGRFDQALYSYERALQLRPDNVTYYGAGMHLQRAGKYKEALAMFIRAHELAPKSENILEAMAASCLHIGDIVGAKALADTLFVIRPNAPGGHVVMMLAALAERNIEAARTSYLAFKTSGVGRPDYAEIIETYGALLD